LHGDRYEVGPLAVLLKPEHGRKILRREKKAGFSPKAAYIFLKQIEEADVVAVNKVDKLTPTERDELIALVQQQFPDKPVIPVSARTGDGFAELIQLLEQPGPDARTYMQVDYDTYADGEAELGWLNCHLTAQRGDDSTFSIDRLVQAIVSDLALRLHAQDQETAHLKVLAQHERGVSIGNLVAAGDEVEMSRLADVEVPQAQVIVNARVATAPAELESTVRESIDAVADREALEIHVQTMRCFRPGRPEPTHRYGVA
jgi:G3E family GTPase